MDLEEYRRLKAEADRLGRNAERAAGARAELLGRLAEFGVADEAAAEKLLRRLRKELAAGEAEYEREKDGWLREYRGRLE